LFGFFFSRKFSDETQADSSAETGSTNLGYKPKKNITSESRGPTPFARHEKVLQTASFKPISVRVL
jgi:hypothetical protein